MLSVVTRIPFHLRWMFAGLVVLATSLSIPVPNARAATTYSIIDLGTLGGSTSFAYDINDNGQIVGAASNSSAPTYWPNRAFLWQNGVMTDLGTFGGGGASANGINNLGQVVGHASSSSTTDGDRAFLWTASGGMVPLMSGRRSYAYGINDNGRVVGVVASSGGSAAYDAFVWDGGSWGTLPTLSGYPSPQPVAINNDNRVVGTVYDGFCGAACSSNNRGVLWGSGPFDPAITDLGTLGGSTSVAAGMNNLGQVVGASFTSDDWDVLEIHPYLWNAGTMTDLGTLGGWSASASDINDAGQVVGASLTASGDRHAFLWQDGVMADLNDLIPASSGWVLRSSTAINNLGQIVGSGDINGNTHAFLLTPLSSPEQQVTALADQVAAINGLHAEQAAVLTDTLDAAFDYLSDPEVGATDASDKLGDFIDKVQDYVENGSLTPTQGQALIDAAGAVITLLTS